MAVSSARRKGILGKLKLRIQKKCEDSMIPPGVWERVWEILDGISDESGENDLGEGYMLKYEGWGGVCVEKVWREVEEEQIRRGADIESEEAEEEREQVCYEYAEEQSYKIIDDE